MYNLPQNCFIVVQNFLYLRLSVYLLACLDVSFHSPSYLFFRMISLAVVCLKLKRKVQLETVVIK